MYFQIGQLEYIFLFLCHDILLEFEVMINDHSLECTLLQCVFNQNACLSYLCLDG